jgi:hypothetical protein
MAVLSWAARSGFVPPVAMSIRLPDQANWSVLTPAAPMSRLS